MKNKIKTVSVILALVVLIPNIALASWWNPTSWFNKKIDETPNIQTLEKQVTSVSETTIQIKNPQINKEEKVKERVIEKPVIKTITVQDPALQAQINSLITENTSLKAQVDKLMQANKSLNDNLSSCEDKPTSTFSANDQCEYAKESLASFTKKYTDTVAKNRVEKERIKENPDEAEERLKAIYKRSGLIAMLSSFDSYSRQEASALIKGVDSAKSAIALYCK